MPRKIGFSVVFGVGLSFGCVPREWEPGSSKSVQGCNPGTSQPRQETPASPNEFIRIYDLDEPLSGEGPINPIGLIFYELPPANQQLSVEIGSSASHLNIEASRTALLDKEWSADDMAKSRSGFETNLDFPPIGLWAACHRGSDRSSSAFYYVRGREMRKVRWEDAVNGIPEAERGDYFPPNSTVYMVVGAEYCSEFGIGVRESRRETGSRGIRFIIPPFGRAEDHQDIRSEYLASEEQRGGPSYLRFKLMALAVSGDGTIRPTRFPESFGSHVPPNVDRLV